ncbi:MAG: ATP-binding cassette domain-containing protein, partial [Oscillospiraceae bacterium]|nr:ATP-binding cassette domain-containing protein [Oscillospiraceae bacterium]
MSFIEFQNVCKIYQMGEVQIKALDDVSFSIDKGEFVVVLGSSGAGKTTILNILGGMDTATSGTIIVDGKEISKASERDLCDYRRTDVGFVFQFYNLVQNLTAKENVDLAIQLCDDPMDSRFVLKMVGLEDRLNN